MTPPSLVAVRAATETAAVYAQLLDRLWLENLELKAAIEAARQYVIDTRLADELPRPGVLLGLLELDPTWKDTSNDHG